MVLEYAEGGDLFDVLFRTDSRRMSEKAATQMVLHPLLRALYYLHIRGIVHRDLKAENIVFKEGVLKLVDLGLAINLHEEQAVTRAGTLVYMVRGLAMVTYWCRFSCL
jgi:serine/threonine protein kinase